jgi:hypothetical protein
LGSTAARAATQHHHITITIIGHVGDAAALYFATEAAKTLCRFNSHRQPDIAGDRSSSIGGGVSPVTATGP